MKHMSLNNGVGHKDSNHNLVSNGAISSVTQSSGDQLVVDHRQVPPRLPIPNNGDRVFITYVKDPLDFRCIPDSTRDEFTEMMNEMEQEYDYMTQDELPMPPKLEVGQLFAALHTDRKWYRVAVKSVVHDSDQVTVYLVDIGEFSIIRKCDLMPLLPKFRNLPFQAIKARLVGIQPPAGHWTSRAVSRFQNMVKNKPMVALVQDVDALATVSMFLMDDSKPPGQENYLHKILINEGHAIGYGAVHQIPQHQMYYNAYS